MANDRFAELMAQTKANKASEAKARAAAAARPKPQPQPERVAPKVRPHQEAASIFGAVKGAMRMRQNLLNALDPSANKGKQ